ncbi:hypothetical protein [Dyadobacter sp. CY312]|uniref:hypothetical protein n=1 Tax=Dyadobacter sp. CY312 TaxID=2907303 RepID=UPI001F1D0C79|nr:hypothetical protein [Dyadobacter sp. CY312]MCE7039676.1 hypothetical protein [Dyadobacter sp. CY312]
MENISMPADHKEVRFTDKSGNTREGIYRDVLKAFVETGKGGDPEDILNMYPENTIVEWEYIHREKNPNADIMVIL